MLWAQITLLVFTGLNLLFAANAHGKEGKEKGNFWITLVATAIAFALHLLAGTYSQIF